MSSGGALNADSRVVNASLIERQVQSRVQLPDCLTLQLCCQAELLTGRTRNSKPEKLFTAG